MIRLPALLLMMVLGILNRTPPPTVESDVIPPISCAGPPPAGRQASRRLSRSSSAPERTGLIIQALSPQLWAVNNADCRASPCTP